MQDKIIVDGIEKMDFEKVTSMLSKADWSKGIKIDEVKEGAENSALVVGAFIDNEQVGYARVISDIVRFAYISDVYVDENYRGQGIAKMMMQYIMNHERLERVYKWILMSYAHELYKGFGFDNLKNTEQWLAISKERPKR